MEQQDIDIRVLYAEDLAPSGETAATDDDRSNSDYPELPFDIPRD